MIFDAGIEQWGITLMTEDIKTTSKRMSRPKQFADPDRVMLLLPRGTFASIARVLEQKEERASFMRESVALLLAIRDPKVYADLKSHLLANESVQDFCIKAIARAVAQRKAALDEGD